VTDANVVLGRIVPENFTEGVVRLDVGAAARSLEPMAAALGLDAEATASGVVRVAESLMADAIRLVTVERGHDPREFTLITFGGAGPLHANRLAAELGIPTTVIPPNPSVLSALGMLLSDFQHEHRRTRVLPLDDSSIDAIADIFDRLDAAAIASLQRDRIPASARRLRRRVEARYVGQSWTLPIAIRSRRPTAIIGEVARSFAEMHRRAYGYAVEGQAVEIVTFTVVGVGRNRGRTLRESRPSAADAAAGGTPARPGHWRREALRVGWHIEGPALIDELGSTTVVEPGFAADVQAGGMLVITRRQPTRTSTAGAG